MGGTVYQCIRINDVNRKKLPLIKIIGISNLHLILFALLFPLSSLSQLLLFLNKYANYSYRRNWNLPVNPVRPFPWFYGGERQIVRLATPVLWLSLWLHNIWFSNFQLLQFSKFLLEVIAIERKKCREESQQYAYVFSLVLPIFSLICTLVQLALALPRL